MTVAANWRALRELVLTMRTPAEEDATFFDLAQAAQRELDAAYSQFREANDPDLVDHAIYRLHAAERHYIFILRQVREAQNMSSGGGASIGSTRG